MQIELNIRSTPFFRVPAYQDLLLFLIQKELQGTKLTMELERIGFDHSLYAPDLGDVILSLAGFEYRNDALWDWYFSLVDEYAGRVELGNQASAQEQAFEMFLKVREKCLVDQDVNR